MWLVMYIIFLPFGFRLAANIGLKHSIALSTPFLVAHTVLLLTLPKFGWPLILLSAMYALSQVFFVPAFHLDFIISSDKKHRARQVSTLNSVVMLVAAAAPILSGIIVVTYGFPILFFIALVIMAASPVPLLFSKDIHIATKIKYRNLSKNISKTSGFVFLSDGVVLTTEMFIWPLFIFLTLGSFIFIGFVASISLVAGSVAMLLFGKLTDHFKPKKILKPTSILYSASLFFRNLSSAAPFMAAITMVGAIAYTMVTIPFNARLYNLAQKSHTADFVVFREMMSALGGVLVVLILLITGSFSTAFVGAGLAALTFLLF